MNFTLLCEYKDVYEVSFPQHGFQRCLKKTFVGEEQKPSQILPEGIGNIKR